MPDCVCGAPLKLVQVWEIPEMKLHDDDEPIYGDGTGHYWYEGEKIIKRDMLICEECADA